MGIIYKITCNITGECYIGSTNQPFEKRMTNHKSPSTNVYASKQIIERGDYQAEVIETNELDDVELKKREQYYLDTMDNINKIRAYITEEQRIIRDSNTKKEYYKNHKEELIKKNGDRRRENYLYEIKCACGTTYQKRNEARHKRTKKHVAYLDSL